MKERFLHRKIRHSTFAYIKQMTNMMLFMRIGSLEAVPKAALGERFCLLGKNDAKHYFSFVLLPKRPNNPN
jgi:hypothetical protein